MHCTRICRRPVIALLPLFAACSSTHDVSGPSGRDIRRTTTAASAVSVIDLANGISGSGGIAIANNGLIIGNLGATKRVWWQSPSPNYTEIDNGYVSGGNSIGDVTSNGTVLLTSAGAPPFTSVSLLLPPGITAYQMAARDLNDSRTVIGTANGRSFKWSDPYSAPIELSAGNLSYPVTSLFVYGISNSGLIAGYAVVSPRKNSSIGVPLVWSATNSATALPVPVSGTSATASNVNDHGVVSGHWNTGRMWVPIRWTPKPTGGYDIATLNLDVGGNNVFTGIDACDRITGGSPQGAWVWDPTAGVTVLPGIGGPGIMGWSHSISSSGEMVGGSMTGSGRTAVLHLTLWTGLPACTQ